MKLSQAVTLAVLCGAFPSIQAAVVPTPAASSALPTGTAQVTGLNALATAAGKLYFGSATQVDELSDTTYNAYLEVSQHFGQITPGNSMKWVGPFLYMTAAMHILNEIISGRDRTRAERVHVYTG